MTKHLKIYEAGKMGGLTFEQMIGWRLNLKEKLIDMAEKAGYSITVINPVDFYNYQSQKHQSEEEVEDYDLAHVISSDIIIVNLDGLNSSEGTKLELHSAKYHNKIPVIAFGDEKLYYNLHPWHQRNITRVEPNIDRVVQYIRDFYMI